MPIPTELVGSLPRPEKLQEAYEDLDHGYITFAQLQELQDEAAADLIRRLEHTGETSVTDASHATLADDLTLASDADGVESCRWTGLAPRC